MNDNPALPGGQLKSKPTWGSIFGCASPRRLFCWAGEQGCDETESIPVPQKFHVACRQVTISSVFGLRLRAAYRIVRLAQLFQSEVSVRRNGIVADGRSILDLLCLAAGCGTMLAVEARGCDAEHAVAALANLISTRCHEFEDQIENSAGKSLRQRPTQSPPREDRSPQSHVNQKSDRSWNCRPTWNSWRRGFMTEPGMNRRNSTRGHWIRGGFHDR